MKEITLIMYFLIKFLNLILKCFKMAAFNLVFLQNLNLLILYAIHKNLQGFCFVKIYRWFILLKDANLIA